MNINEIAKLAGVSRATVSRYLNDGYVSEEKKEIIRQVIEQTGYKPSMQARNLRNNITRLIGVIIPRIQSEAVNHMVAGISEILSADGYQLLLANTQNKPKEELKYLRLFRKNQVDGIIFMGTIFSKEHLKLMKEVDVPIVIAAQELDNYSCVYQDDYHAAYDAASLLSKTGTHFGYIGVTEKDKAAGESRKKGTLDALKENGIKIAKKNIYETQFKVDGGYEKTRCLLEQSPDIDTIICATDGIAAGALRFIHEKNISVPDQIQLLGFGDTELGNVVTPAITSVHFHYKTTGMESAKLLLEILQSGNDMQKKIKMGYQLIEKGSTR